VRATVLITDGEQRAALAAVRALGRMGHEVLVTSSRDRSLAGASRYAAADLTVPDPLAQPLDFVRALERIVQERAIDVLVPLTDAALLAVLAERERFAPCRIPFPDLDRVRAVGDKAEVLRAAQEVGIASPAQRVIASPGGLASLDLVELAYPLVVKPVRSIADLGNGGRQKLSVRHAATPDQLRGRLDALPASAYPLLLQQRIVGPGIGIFLLPWSDSLVATFAHRRIREKPPSGGVSVYRESIAADPKLVACSLALLHQFAWEGVAMVEYKLDATTGVPYLMEINGRFWGSLQLAIDAGVNFPGLLVSLALGEHPAPVTAYRLGVRSRWWLGDLDQLLAQLRLSSGELALPPGSPGRARALLDFLTLWRPGDRSEIFRWSDPMPAIRETVEWMQGR
jgi:predicted ATP-grasp superfamily ATP-dependent carboligase